MNKVFNELSKSLFELVLIIAVFYFLFWPVKVDGSSMENTFQSGDRVVFCKIMAMADQINRHDIIVAKLEEDDTNILIIKRVVAIAGDSVQIKDGNVYVNDVLQKEDYIKGRTYGDIELTVPENFLFVLGDNRPVSKDSRMFGPVAAENVEGKVIMRLYPFRGIHFY